MCSIPTKIGILLSLAWGRPGKQGPQSAVSHGPITAFTGAARRLLCQAGQYSTVMNPGFEL